MGLNPLETILTATIEGLSKGDLSGLNTAVEESVKHFSEQTILSTGEATRRAQEKLNEERIKKQQELEARRKKEAELRKSQSMELLVPFKPVGKTGAVLEMVFGGIGFAFSGMSFITNLVSFVLLSLSPSRLIVSAIFMAVFGVMINTGKSNRRLLERAKRFAQLCGSKQYILVEDLSKSVNQSKSKTLSDIRKMLKKGYFPEGHIDEEKTTLMLTDSVYNEYVKSGVRYKAIEDSKKAVIDTTAREVTQEEDELSLMIKEGNGYRERLHALNAEIPGEVITQKLTTLETLLLEIFTGLKKHPEQMPKMHELMNYYLPTVEKLVSAYKEYDGITQAGSEIMEAKSQIEGSIDTINEALRKILNNLFRDSVWDVTTDAEVLNTMLAQKGLASPFKDKQ